MRQVAAAAGLGGAEPALEWPRARLSGIKDRGNSPSHSDYHPANALINPARQLVVLDWTADQLAANRFDLASSLAFLPPVWHAPVISG